MSHEPSKLEIDVLLGFMTEICDEALDAARELATLALNDPNLRAQVHEKCARVARRIRTLASFQLDVLTLPERNGLRSVLYELADELEDL